MKRAILLSVLIAVVACLLGWHAHARVQVLSATQERLVTQMRSMGISPDDPGFLSPRRLRTRGGSESQAAMENRVGKVAQDIISLTQQYMQAANRDEEPDLETIKHLQELLDEVASMNKPEMQCFFTTILADWQLEWGLHNGMLCNVLVSLSNDHPEWVLPVLGLAHSDLFAESTSMRKWMTTTALGSLAESDPETALQWLSEQQRLGSIQLSEHSTLAIVRGVSKKDPARAFQLIRESEDEQVLEKGYRTIAATVGSLDEASGLLKIAQEELGNIKDPEEQKKAMESINGGIANFDGPLVHAGFEKASKWLEDAGLSSEQQLAMVSEMRYGIVQNDDAAGQWLEWMGKADTDEKTLSENALKFADQWVRQDAKAMEQWLSDTPEGTVRDVAIAAYSQAQYFSNPQTTMEWIAQMPDGKLRRETLRDIHGRMPRQTDEQKQAADTFAREHGIE